MQLVFQDSIIFFRLGRDRVVLGVAPPLGREHVVVLHLLEHGLGSPVPDLEVEVPPQAANPGRVLVLTRGVQNAEAATFDQLSRPE